MVKSHADFQTEFPPTFVMGHAAPDIMLSRKEHERDVSQFRTRLHEEPRKNRKKTFAGKCAPADHP